MAEFTIKNAKYQTGKLSARKQLHIARRLAGFLPAIVAVYNAADDADKIAALTPFADAISGMPEADVDYVLDACLFVAQRQQPGGGWAPIMTSNGDLMFEDIDMTAMVRIAFEVVRDNLQSFFAELPSLLPLVKKAPAS